ncbi:MULTISPECIES: M20 aminoacylase family protein [Pantoea]|jgi:hippurate hydrolase|uniref:M20 aminoacylase family protein n=1 Tax=Pantoea TaxID=53335 RepID=UPI001559035E|nr:MULTISPECIES: M20 aminoacylase family protein [Pantoea]MBD8251215.1 amidohydrolase [Pantoea agglomerans]MBD8260879.1 amidohydrolase [Pantoea agglomerans]NQS79641.1 amidohydrolase [Pantoea agglomerans]WNK38952.1 M20 aminoacylase family protein [Pantoea agglomerans]WNK59376.1 M20 aminoacylase family protein [Pantoea agglomerans]
MEHLVALRRDLHAHPELGFQEQRTSDIVANFLQQLGIEVHRGIGKTGVVGILKKGSSERMIGLRADMDALPMQDQSGTDWQSRLEQVSHACGHDGHTVMLLGAAEKLARDVSFDGSVCFIFQPAEEGLAGAKAMIDDGLFSRFPCEAVYAIHNWPELPLGQVQTRPGAIMAAADRFDIRVLGGGGHAAQPHLTRDTLLATSELVVQLNTLVSRALDPCETALLTVTRMQGGFSHNMIPAEANITGTVRTFSPAAQATIEARLRQMAEHITAAHGLHAEVSYLRYYPATLNSNAEAQFCLQALTQAGITAEAAPQPALTSEDFAFMLQARPGAYLWLGSAPCKPLHHAAYDFNDALIPHGVNVFVTLIRQALAEKFPC